MSLFRPIKSGNTYESSNEEIALETQGTVQLEAGYNEKAISIFNSAISAYPKNPYFYYLRGYSKQNLKEYLDAISDFQNYLEIHQNHYNALFRIALSHQHLNNFQKALEFYKRSIKYFKEFKTTIETLAEEVNKSENINDNYFNIPKEKIYGNMANVKMSLKDWEGALNDCENAISINSDYPQPYFLRGIYFYNREEHEQAKINIKKAANLGFDQANAALQQLYGNETSNDTFFAEVKQFADSPEAKQRTGGTLMRTGFKPEISSALSKFDNLDISILHQVAVSYMKNMWQEYVNVAGSIDDFNKAIIAYELSKAIEELFPQIDQDNFWRTTFKEAHSSFK
jgi:tetratricopeptide (TPR) repeat protein